MKTPLHTKKVIKWQLINTNQVHSKPSLAPGLKPAAPWPFPLFPNGARDLRKLRRERDGADLERTVEGHIPGTTADVSRASEDAGSEAEEGKEEGDAEVLEETVS